jgi:hypothetical protein
MEATMKFVTVAVLFGMVTLGSTLMVAYDDAAMTIYTQAQVAQLEQLHAAFHRAASVHNIVTGDSQEVIDARIRQIQSLWTKDAVLKLNTGSPFDGYYIGKGTPGDSSTCPCLPVTQPIRGLYAPCIITWLVRFNRQISLRNTLGSLVTLLRSTSSATTST